MSTCPQCGADVTWAKVGAKKLCLNPDGSDHWGLCSRLRFERVKRAGEYFHGQAHTAQGALLHTEGYRAPFKTQLVLIRLDKPVVGKNYRPDGCDCGLPPWDLCRPDCRHALRKAA